MRTAIRAVLRFQISYGTGPPQRAVAQGGLCAWDSKLAIGVGGLLEAVILAVK